MSPAIERGAEQAFAAAQEIVTLAERSFTDRPDIMAYAYASHIYLACGPRCRTNRRIADSGRL